MITKNINGQDLTTAYSTVVSEPNRDWSARLYADGVLLDCSIVSFEITKGSCGTDESFSIGNIISSMLEAELKELTTDIKGADIEVQIGLNTGQVEWITLGHFIAVEVKKTPYTATLTGYGYSTAKAGGSFTLPATLTLASIANAIGTAMGCQIVFDSGISTSLAIRGTLESTGCYEGLQVLAHLVGGYACDTNDGKIAIRKYSSTPTVTVDSDRMIELPSLEESDFSITGAKVIVQEADPDADPPQGEISYSYGNPIVIYDENPNMTWGIFDGVYKAIVGYVYRTGTVGISVGDPRIEGNDVVQVVDVDGTTYNVPCHKVTHTYDGGLSTRVEAVKATADSDGIYSVAPITQRFDELGVAVSIAKASAESAQASAESALESAQEAQRIVGELEDDVEDLNGRVQTAEGKITTIEGNITSLDGRVSTAEGKITTVEGNITSLTGRVSDAETDIGNIEDDITALDGRVSGAETDIGTIEGNITTINGQITTINGDVSNLTGRVQTAEGKVTTLEGQVATAQGDITALQGRISTAEGNISAVEGDITTLQGRVSDAEEDVTETLHALGVAEAVIDTINWIADHGTMTLTTDTQVDPNKVYFVVDPNGIYEVGGTHYAIVENPTQSGLSTYYELTTDSAISNYIESHITLTSAGLVVTKDNTKWYVLVKNDGIDIVDNTTGLHKVVASYGASVTIGQNANGYSRTEIGTSGMQIYQKDSNGNDVEIANLGYGLGNAQSGTAYAPYFTFGKRASGSAVGNYSVAEGVDATSSGKATHAEGDSTTASGRATHAEGYGTTASNFGSHAEGYYATANGQGAHAEGDSSSAGNTATHAEGEHTLALGRSSHAEGYYSRSVGNYSHAGNNYTTAQGRSQTTIGEFNVLDPPTLVDMDNRGAYALIVGNGTADNARSNALTVAWTGDVVASGDVTDGTGNVLSAKANTSSLATVATTGNYNDLSNTPSDEFFVNGDTGAGTQILGGEMYFTGGDFIDTTASDQNGESEITIGCNKSSLLDFFYPVGSYYETSNTTFNPNTAWGGTWVEDTAGYVTVAQDTTQTEFDTIGETGGDKHIQDHAHGFTQPKIPKHQHQLQRQQLATATSGSNRWFASGTTVGGSTANDGGGGACTGGSVGNVQTTAHGTMTTGNSGNLQPYIVVKRWHRTA